MRVLTIHTVPVWQEDSGHLTYGLEPRADAPPVIGWANLALIAVDDTPRWFLLTC